MKFTFGSLLDNIDYDQILSANYRIYEIHGYKGAMQVEAYMVKESWQESTITWNNKPAYDEEKLTVVNVGVETDQEVGTYVASDFYITKAVMAWKQKSNLNNGIMLKSRLEGAGGMVSRTFFSSETSSSYPPHLSITYVEEETSMENIGIEDGTQYYIKNKNSGKYLMAMGTAANLDVMHTDWTGNANQQRTVQYQNNGYYKLIPGNASNLVLGTNYGTSVSGLAFQLRFPSTNLGQEFKFIRNWDGSYKIVTHISNGNYGLQAYTNQKVYHMRPTVDWTKDDDWTLELVNKGDADVYSFVLWIQQNTLKL